MVGFGFCPKILCWWLGPTSAFYCSVNVDGVVTLLGSGGDILTLHVVIKFV